MGGRCGPLCRAVDDKRHRILQCPATDHVRHGPYMSEALARFPHWLHGPEGTKPPNTEVPRLIFVSAALPAAA